MSNKYFGGVVENKGVTEPVDDDLKNFILSVPARVNEKMDKLRVADAMTEVFTIFKRLSLIHILQIIGKHWNMRCLLM